MFNIVFEETKNGTLLGDIRDTQILRKRQFGLIPKNYFYVMMKRRHKRKRSHFIIGAKESNSPDVDGAVYRKESEKGK